MSNEPTNKNPLEVSYEELIIYLGQLEYNIMISKDTIESMEQEKEAVKQKLKVLEEELQKDNQE